MSSDMSAHNEPIRIYPEGSVTWDEAWRQRQRADAAEASNLAYRTEYDRIQAELAEQRQENAKLRERCDCVGRHKLEQEIERLRAELAALKATAPYLVEQQQPATVEQGEWRVVKDASL